MSTDKVKTRILSMDQFRGYTVAGMFLVNFCGSYSVVKSVLEHGDGVFKYADSIMPSFIFCAGFSFRLTALRRFAEMGTAAATWSYIRRSLGLIGISLMIFGLGGLNFEAWKDITPDSFINGFWELIKADIWEVLSIIGMCQILLLPVITRSFRFRLAATIGLFFLYIAMNYSFNYNFQAGLDNWMNKFFGADTRRSWDGGCFGIFGWSIPMLAGTLACDVLQISKPGRSIFVFFLTGTLLMVLGYGTSCLTRLYDRVEGDEASQTAERHADDPVWPRSERWTKPGIGWAEPPFVDKPGENVRQYNFWMMQKRIVSPSFTLFAIGFAMVVYCLFIAASDIGGLQVSLFRTFGQNPLAAYIIHEITMHSIKPLAPKDSSFWWLALVFLLFFSITWGALKYMEKNKLFLRL